MYSFPNLEPVHCSMSSSSCCFLTYIQVSQETGNVVCPTGNVVTSHLLKNFPVCYEMHTVKDFNIISEAEVDFFFFLEFYSYDTTDVGNLISGSSTFPKPGLNIWKFSFYTLLKPGLVYFEHYFASM